MKRLLICCIFGNTATTLAKKMQIVADARRYHIQISGVGADGFESIAPAFDCFLVAPHIQYKLHELKKYIKEGQPIEIIAGYPYASIDAEKILDFAIEHMGELTD
jgi:PTS system cellobiose-specific IIB component